MFKGMLTAAAVLLAAAPVAAQSSSAFAPAQLRFGTMQLTPPAIAVVIRRMRVREQAFPSWTPSIFGPLAATEDALRDWEGQYPDDPRIARDLFALETTYLQARGDRGLQSAIRTEGWLRRDYGGTEFAVQATAALERIAGIVALPGEPAPPPPVPEPPIDAAPPLAEPPLEQPPPEIAEAPPAAPLRHLDYAIDVGADGQPHSGQLHVDFIATHGEGAVTVDIAEELRDGDDRTIRADIGRDGAISTVLDATLSDAELVLLGAFSLEAENINGVDVGDAWQRETAIPGGHASTHYSVAKNDGQGHVVLKVTRRLQFANGEQSSWNGNVEYDANSFVPTAVAFNGNVSAGDEDTSHPHHVSLTLKLQNDTFNKH